MPFNPEQPVQYRRDTGTSQSGWFVWNRNNQTASERRLRPGHFDARIAAVFTAIAVVSGIALS